MVGNQETVECRERLCNRGTDGAAGGYFEKNQNFPARPPIVSTLDAKIKDLLATSATELQVYIELRKDDILSSEMV